MEKDLKGLSVCGHYDELGDAAVKRLGGLVGALLQLLVVGGLRHTEDFIMRVRSSRAQWRSASRKPQWWEQHVLKTIKTRPV